jgi:mannonate dehydratase
MNRRQFAAVAGAGAALAGATMIAGSRREEKSDEKPKKRPVRMYVGCQRSPTNAEMLQFFKRHGVDHICGYPVIKEKGRGHWTVEELSRLRDLCDKHGVALDMVALPFLKSSHIDRTDRPAIMLGKDPERKKDVEDVRKCIEACAKVKVPAIKYNMSILGVLRTKPTRGRGGSILSTWKLKEAKPAKPLTRAGKVTADMAWERITWFLEQVVPVCETNKVRMACHPHDPGVPATGYQGVVRVLGSVEGLKKFISIKQSAYHGLNFCIGSIAEGMKEPAREIHEAIRYFGKKGKIFNVHFRNIKGGRDDFREVYPDEGDMNMAEVLRTLWEVDYAGMVMPDHMPKHPDDPNGRLAFAYAYGYIKGLLQSLRAG